MKFIQIEYFLELEKQKSFSKAADALFISQPALSLQISSLENELGVRLFERMTEGVFLTESGRVFLLHAQKIKKEWDSLKSDMELCLNKKLKLKIGLGPRVYSNDLLEPIISFFDERPEVDVTYISDFTQKIFDDLNDGTIDVALERLPPSNVITDMHMYFWQELINERTCFLLSPKDPKGSCSELDYEDLKDYAFVSGPEGSRLDINMTQDCIDHDLPITRAYRSNSMNDIMDMVRNGRGYLIGPVSYGKHFHVAAVPKKDKSYAALCFICLKRKKDDPLISSFLEYLLQICQKK